MDAFDERGEFSQISCHLLDVRRRFRLILQIRICHHVVPGIEKKAGVRRIIQLFEEIFDIRRLHVKKSGPK